MKLTFILSLLFLSTITCFSQINKATPSVNKPFILGEIRELHSSILNENRVLNVYLPEGYNEKDSLKYPVIYLLDGSADEDFIHIVGLVQYNSFEWINQLPKSVVVGIATVDRRRDFTFPTSIEADKKRYPTTGYSDKFISFLNKELQPFIQEKYKVSTFKTLIGQSLGGLLATEILFKSPDLFNTYIIVSPSLWWNNGSLLNYSNEKIKNAIVKQTNVFIAVGKEGLTPTEIPRVMEVDVNLLVDKLNAINSVNINVLFDYLPAEDHATIMHQAVGNAFRQLNKIRK